MWHIFSSNLTVAQLRLPQTLVQHYERFSDYVSDEYRIYGLLGGYYLNGPYIDQ